MSTNRQKSFIATMSLWGVPVAMVQPPFNSNRMLWGQNSQHVPDKMYFRCEGDYYVIFIRSEGLHYGKTIDQAGAVFVANPPAGSKTTSFNIIDNKSNNIVTLDDLRGETVEVYLKTRNGYFLTADFNYSDYPKMIRLDAPTASFQLHILERNVPYLNNPSEI